MRARRRLPGLVVSAAILLDALFTTVPPGVAQTSGTFKVASFNIQSGKGEPGLAGRPVLFAETMNCTDASQPLNAWGVGFVQKHLREAIANDGTVVALALAEAWGCGSPENVRQVLGWKARSSERNGVALLAKHGFAGAEEWFQLDTSMNPNPADTMWVLRRPVCLDADCATSINVFAAHWYVTAPSGSTYEQWSAVVPPGYDRQAAQTVEFLKRAGGAEPHVLIGDLNTWEAAERTCRQWPPNSGLSRLREAGYVDAWPLIHGSAEGLTGMTNRAGCGTPEGYVWKRPDYAWSPANFLPVSMQRFAMVTAGDAAPSDHYGLIVEFPLPGTTVTLPLPPPPPPPPPSPSSDEIVVYAKSATAAAGAWRLINDAQAAGGARMSHPDQGGAKLQAASSAPADYFEVKFYASAGRAYRLWIRGIADRNYWGNDSVFVQFDGSVTDGGTPQWRIGTTSAATVNLEDASGAGLAGWGWQDNGYGAGVLGPLVYFASTGLQTLRTQTREDGFSIDQIVLSPGQYLTSSPGSLKNDPTILPEASGSDTTEPPPVDPPPTDPPPPSTTEIVLLASDAKTVAGTWRTIADSTAARGIAVGSPDAGLAKPSTAAASPANYVEFTFDADSARPYRLWLRGRADRDYWGNDSVFVQFSNAITSSGAPMWRLNTIDAATVNLEDAVNAGLAAWGWQDNGYGAGVLGPVVRFATSGTHTIRLQTREDGFRIDQIVLSAEKYLHSSPGSLKNDTTILR